jgi:16S rRNA (adenine1518-N6/adenine1519-N6)-dimethyltransferase
MRGIRAKKRLGQHFLSDRNMAEQIAGTLTLEGYRSVLEIGPGTGALTRYLVKRGIEDLRAIEFDRESVEWLKREMPALNLIEGDFLKYDIGEEFDNPFAITGNFPYNISSQILFRVLDLRRMIPEVTGMFQKEVAERIASPPGSRKYGILSVLLQTFYDIEYLFSVPPEMFTPPPAVISAVIRMKRNGVVDPGCDFTLMKKVVKATFNQRRKMIRNSLSSMCNTEDDSTGLMTKRPEHLSVADFVLLTNWAARNRG